MGDMLPFAEKFVYSSEVFGLLGPLQHGVPLGVELQSYPPTQSRSDGNGGGGRWRRGVAGQWFGRRNLSSR
jgi:hypothetical protein